MEESIPLKFPTEKMSIINPYIVIRLIWIDNCRNLELISNRQISHSHKLYKWLTANCQYFLIRRKKQFPTKLDIQRCILALFTFNKIIFELFDIFDHDLTIGSQEHQAIFTRIFLILAWLHKLKMLFELFSLQESGKVFVIFLFFFVIMQSASYA